MDDSTPRSSPAPALAALKTGAHLCFLYQTEEEHRALVTPFLRRGLEQGERVLYLADADTAEAILASLRRDGLDATPFLAGGRLRFLAGPEVSFRAGAFDPERLLAFLRAETDQAVADGCPALRVTGEMTWALRGLPGPERLSEYEAKLNELLPGGRCLVLCQYDRRRFTAEIQLDVLETHPIVAVGVEVRDNPCYLPPKAVLAEDRSAAKLEQRLKILTERGRDEARIGLVARALEASASGIVITDREGTIQWVNPAFTTMTGYAAEEAIGRNPRLLKSGRQDLEFYRRLWGTITAGRVWRGELVNKRKDGALYHEEMAIAPVRDDGGEIRHFVAIKQDITARKQMESHAQRIERLAAMGQLLGGIAHDIKNALFVVNGRIRLLQEKVANREYEGLETDIEKVAEAVRHMDGTARRFLSFARPARPSLQVCSITPLVEGVLDFLSAELTKRRIAVVTDFAPDLPPCSADPAHLHQALLNLVLNAVQAMAAAHGGGTLTVTARLATDAEQDRRGDAAAENAGGRGWIEVRVQDDGPGIAPEHRDRLFEPFFTTKPADEGTGLGLWTTRTIVQDLGGTVTFETEVGRGTTFIVRLPVAEGSER